MNCSSKLTAAAGAAILLMVVASCPAVAETTSSSDEQIVTVRNTGEVRVELGVRHWPEGFLAGTTPVQKHCGQYLEPGELCQIAVRFAPTHAGSYSGELRIAVNDREHPFLTVKLSGTGVSAHGGPGGGRR